MSTIKVLAVDAPEWTIDENNRASLLGEFADENEAMTEIWRDLVEKKQHKTYLLIRNHRWVKSWRKPISIVWGRLHGGMPKIYQESLEDSKENTLSKLYKLIA